MLGDPRLRFHLLSFCSLCLFFFHGVESSFSSSCSDVVCYGVHIKYPFWIINDDGATTNRGNNTTGSNITCGYQGFGLSCASNKTYPILTLPTDSYYVKDINYISSILTLIDIDVVGQSCPRARHNLSIDTLPLEYHSDDVNITFYFNCSNDIVSYLPPVSPISCLGEYNNRTSYGVLEGSAAAEEYNWTEMRCDEVVVATVKETEVSETDLIGQFARAMNSGFVLEWNATKDCGACEFTHGRCGFNGSTGQFLCFCDNGSIHVNGSHTYCAAGKDNIHLKVGIGVSLGVSVFIVLIALILYCRHRNTGKKAHSYTVSRSFSSSYTSRTDLDKSNLYHGLPIFDYNELQEATNNFDPQKELGEGGFGTVYFGKLRDGRSVAVKRLYENSYKRVEQFMNEVEILSRLRHPNLVILYGCTSRQSHRLLLVYEYVPNGTVADHLHGNLAKPGSLSWSTRLNIAIETASALVYLHATDIIHRDVKTNNILLDENFSVKVADFGLSRLFPFNVTHVSTAPQGTPGYVDPEYHQCYQLTEKSDVYSFGVVLMELLSSLPAVDITRHRHEINLSTMAINRIHNQALHEIVDPHLGFNSNDDTRNMITAVGELGFQCLQSAKDMRPSMSEVLIALKDIRKMGMDENNKSVEREDTFLLKNVPSSPDSVMAKFHSVSTTPNASS
ncbi:hypothetical protein SAY87_004287 [Trapa incisa]|uniref:non-specific serine/threonine protein kinase n=1 Tax=Trapa incisa TaxID=236973 RepID=A0AAN7JP76_9MYRT|nr:hypothetical protein SAY87_004287 [Trapa incisa]